MAIMTWNESYSVNVHSIDDQHKTFFTLINDLHDAMRSGKGKEVLGSTLQALVDYTQTHFSDEERLLRLHGYPDLSKHKAVHDAFVKQTRDLQERFNSGNTMISVEVMNALKDWLIKHIQGTDKRYSDFLNNKGVH